MSEPRDDFDKELADRTYVCPICKKKFTLPFLMSKSEYVYNITIYDSKEQKSVRKKCCSYSCYRKGSK